ncbi:MAG: aminotransferase class I/II-fold pyridoxal phosphate-dependent enzyme [Anaerovibrio sp.]|uniref:trans-sulfuration enzyme family protein n=1 Tax=Anaerovibrio sp. TaxID=1872532 RepID=UPI002E75CE14|nr:aminotransferase class I/II-fold pyridoxal phosphate-dependent enzyme [Anaerovibrio sp.]MEE1307916.1 aminotransferase class I/II-fold pyridoxal phosphate-dependent enzyme [Anaerovibrio sp.]
MHDFTIEVHGCRQADYTGALSQPIYQSATFRHPGFQQSTGYDYSRCGNPTRDNLEETIAALEKGQKAWAFSSGMAAINTVFQLFKPGDHILLTEDLYGGTVRLGEIFAKYGIEFEYIDTTDLELVQRSLRPATRAIFIETPSNPMMLITDIKALAELAHSHAALLVVDNTFLTPHFQKPLTLGADIVVHSGTMISFKVRDSNLARSILGKVKLIAFAESLGGVESLITYPLYQTHECMPKYLLERTGLDDRLLRLSVGIEATEDLIADLQQAFR